MAGFVYSAGGAGSLSISFSRDRIFALERVSDAQLESVVAKSTSNLASRIRARAPYRMGDLQRGIISSAQPERTSIPGKVVHDIYFDAQMNSTFVKTSKAGKRYYYPASQEYGFRIGRNRRHPGLYYMRDAAVAYYSTHAQAVSEGIDKILEDL